MHLTIRLYYAKEHVRCHGSMSTRSSIFEPRSNARRTHIYTCAQTQDWHAAACMPMCKNLRSLVYNLIGAHWNTSEKSIDSATCISTCSFNEQCNLFLQRTMQLYIVWCNFQLSRSSFHRSGLAASVSGLNCYSDLPWQARYARIQGVATPLTTEGSVVAFSMKHATRIKYLRLFYWPRRVSPALSPN
jgi:hypothetical protein